MRTGSVLWYFFFFQAEDGIRDLVRSRGLGDVYKRQSENRAADLLTAMQNRNLVEVRPDGLSLTDAGLEYALHMVRAHRLWERYLADQTGYQALAWHELADQMEHRLTPAAANALAATLGNPTYDPHGDPIPSAEGEVLKVLHRAHPTVVGEFRVGRRGCYVIPHEARIQQTIVIPEGMELPHRGANPDRVGVTERAFHERTAAAILVLLAFMIVMNAAAIFRNRETSQGPADVRNRAQMAFYTAYNLLADLEQVPNKRKALLYISTGYDFDPFAAGRNACFECGDLFGVTGREGGGGVFDESVQFVTQGDHGGSGAVDAVGSGSERFTPLDEGGICGQHPGASEAALPCAGGEFSR